MGVARCVAHQASRIRRGVTCCVFEIWGLCSMCVKRGFFGCTQPDGSQPVPPDGRWRRPPAANNALHVHCTRAQVRTFMRSEAPTVLTLSTMCTNSLSCCVWLCTSPRSCATSSATSAYLMAGRYTDAMCHQLTSFRYLLVLGWGIRVSVGQSGSQSGRPSSSSCARTQ